MFRVIVFNHASTARSPLQAPFVPFV